MHFVFLFITVGLVLLSNLEGWHTESASATKTNIYLFAIMIYLLMIVDILKKEKGNNGSNISRTQKRKERIEEGKS